MIVPMKKVTLLVSRQEKDAALTALRKMGVVHINIPRNLISDDITRLEEKLNRGGKAMRALPETEFPAKSTHDSARDVIDDILEIEELRANLVRRLEELREKEKWYKRWGKISLKDVKSLAEKGFFVKLYATSRSALEELPQDAWVFEIGGDKNDVRLALIATDEKEKLPFKEEVLPDMELGEILEELNEIEKDIGALGKKLLNYTGDADKIKGYIDKTEKALTLARVRDSMAEEGPVVLLEGFIPEDKKDLIKKGADKYGWGYILDEPSEDDDPPTLVRTPKWVQIIKPVFDFMGTVPGYREYDISMWFLIFFSLFFAMLIGDAGYGIIFILLTVWARKRMKQAPPEPFRLMYVLGGATFFWGVISGTWFGSATIASIPFLQQFIISPVSSFDLSDPSAFNDNQHFMMSICFVIGAIHLTIAHLVNAWNLRKSLKALGQVGWALIIGGVYFLAGTLVLNKPMPSYGTWLLAAGFLMALFFSAPEKGIIKGSLSTLGNLPLDMISGFSDVVSYLRLFAVGYATVVVAHSFNQMAIGEGISGFIPGLIAALILFLGHALNIILGAMSMIVHGVRLNMLWFSGHMGMEWSGMQYKPFSES